MSNKFRVRMRICSNSISRAAGDSWCYLSCFDEQSLLYLKNLTALPLFLIVEHSVSDQQLVDWARSFHGLDVWHDVLAPHFGDDHGYKNWIGENATDLVARAHAHGLKVDCVLFAL